MPDLTPLDTTVQPATLQVPPHPTPVMPRNDTTQPTPNNTTPPPTMQPDERAVRSFGIQLIVFGAVMIAFVCLLYWFLADRYEIPIYICNVVIIAALLYGVIGVLILRHVRFALRLFQITAVISILAIIQPLSAVLLLAAGGTMLSGSINFYTLLFGMPALIYSAIIVFLVHGLLFTRRADIKALFA